MKKKRLILLGGMFMNLSFSNHLENSYLNETDFPIVKNNYVVISGCSSGGKSTLLSELAKRDYAVVAEPGRQIVKEQTIIEGDALPWTCLGKFLELALSRALFLFNSQQEAQKLIFFDRGIIDTVQLEQPQPPHFHLAARKFKYNRFVFLVPPWKEIFVNDAERQHDFESATKEFCELLIKYKHFGYEVVLVPKISVKERADFILEILNKQE
jgi:predicted ATPase